MVYNELCRRFGQLKNKKSYILLKNTAFFKGYLREIF